MSESSPGLEEIVKAKQVEVFDLSEGNVVIDEENVEVKTWYWKRTQQGDLR